MRHRRTARRARAPTDSELATTDQRHWRNSNPEPKRLTPGRKKVARVREIPTRRKQRVQNLVIWALLGTEATREKEGTLIFGPISATLFLSAQGLQSRATDLKLKLTANTTRAPYGTRLIMAWAQRH